MHFHAPVHFSVRSFHWAQVPGVPLRLPQARPTRLGASPPVPEQLTLPLAGLAIKQQFCMLGKDVFCLQPPCSLLPYLPCSLRAERDQQIAQPPARAVPVPAPAGPSTAVALLD